MEGKAFIILLAALFCSAAGGIFARKAKKTGSLPCLIISVVFAALCLVGIILAVIDIFILK